jgi:serine/threonine protein kinase
MEKPSPELAAKMAQVEEDRRNRLRLWLITEQCADLLPLLDAAVGRTVSGLYRIERLLAAGRQFFVWMATELSTGRRAVLKQARFDYRHPILYGRADVERLRAAIRREYDVLWADRSGTLPRPLSLVVADSPVPAAKDAPLLARGEVFVAEEHIRAFTIAELALRIWPHRPPEEREAAVARMAADFVRFWEALASAGWCYCDVSGDNLLVDEAGKLRVVDGGSAVAMADRIVLAGFTPAFMTPNLFAAANALQPLPATLATILPPLGKIIHFALTRREPFNGQFPEVDESTMPEYSPLCRLVVDLLLQVDRRPDRLSDARDALFRWASGSP